MKNIYYYSFYFLSAFIKIVNKRNKDYAFSGMAFLVMLMTFNVFTILSFTIKYEIIEINPYILSIFIMLPLMGINYYFLISNNKSRGIINLYEEKWKLKKNDFIYLIVFLFYVIISILSCGYAAYLIKNHQM